MAIMLTILAILLARRHLMSRMTGMRGRALLLVLGVGLLRLCRWRRLSGSGHGERKRDRAS